MPGERGLTIEARRRRARHTGFVIPRRRSGQQAVSQPLLEVGDLDPMSYFAQQARVPICGESTEDAVCTRALGHDESMSEPCGMHVAVDEWFCVLHTWHP